LAKQSGPSRDDRVPAIVGWVEQTKTRLQTRFCLRNPSFPAVLWIDGFRNKTARKERAFLSLYPSHA
jgi:hypothetical protein